jgi:hypothetical protein
MRNCGLGVRTKIPKGQSQRYQQESHGEFTPRDLDGRLRGGLGGGSSRILLAESAGERIGCASLGGILMTTIFVAPSFVATLLIPAIFMFAAVFLPGLRDLRLQFPGLRILRFRVANDAVIVVGIGGAKGGTGKNGFKSIFGNIFGNLVDLWLLFNRLGRGHRGGFRLRSA